MKKFVSIILCIFIFSTSVLAVQNIESETNAAISFIQQNVSSPLVASAGGEWSVIALARYNAENYESFFAKYLDNLKNTLDMNSGILHQRRFTEYSRVILALTALGENASDFCGYNLIFNISDLSNIKLQGVNGCIYALLALDSGGFSLPSSSTATRSALINEILSAQNSDGGFSLSGGSDVDITAAALQALSKYAGVSEVASAIDSALNYLSSVQLDDGGFSGWGGPNSESTSQVIIALCELGIDIEDPLFVKNGLTALDSLLASQNSDGGFSHNAEQSVSNLMATEQALCALVSLQLHYSNEPSLYNMSVSRSLKISADTPLTSTDIWNYFTAFTKKLGAA